MVVNKDKVVLLAAILDFSKSSTLTKWHQADLESGGPWPMETKKNHCMVLSARLNKGSSRLLASTPTALLSDLQTSDLQRTQIAALAVISSKGLKKLSPFHAPSPLKKIQARAAPPNAKIGSF